MNNVVVDNGSDGLSMEVGNHETISYRAAQAFYSEITGRSEQLSEEYNCSFILEKESIEQLHLRIAQSTAQYKVLSSNVSFTIEYLKSSSERYNID